MAYGLDTKENRKAGNDAVKIMRKQAKEDKKKARKAAKAAAEAFGISEYDAYDVILEAMSTIDFADVENDDDLASAIEAML